MQSRQGAANQANQAKSPEEGALAVIAKLEDFGNHNSLSARFDLRKEAAGALRALLNRTVIEPSAQQLPNAQCGLEDAMTVRTGLGQ